MLQIRAIHEATKLHKPVRHVFKFCHLIPQNKLMLNSTGPLCYTASSGLQATPGPTRPSSYCFWMFGYWLGLNKLQKTEELAYKDGDIALFVMDNSFAPAALKALLANTLYNLFLPGSLP